MRVVYDFLIGILFIAFFVGSIALSFVYTKYVAILAASFICLLLFMYLICAIITLGMALRTSFNDEDNDDNRI